MANVWKIIDILHQMKWNEVFFFALLDQMFYLSYAQVSFGIFPVQCRDCWSWFCTFDSAQVWCGDYRQKEMELQANRKSSSEAKVIDSCLSCCLSRSKWTNNFVPYSEHPNSYNWLINLQVPTVQADSEWSARSKTLPSLLRRTGVRRIPTWIPRKRMPSGRNTHTYRYVKIRIDM